jgi:methionyl-tRNA formyltransferase
MNGPMQRPDDETTTAAFHAYRAHLAQVVTQATAHGHTTEERWAMVEAKMTAWSQRITEHVQDLQWHRYTSQALNQVHAIDPHRELGTPAEGPER